MTTGKRLIAVVDLALRKSPDRANPDYDVFLEWPAGTAFAPPPHMRTDLAIKRQIAAWEGDAEGLASAQAYHEEKRREAMRRSRRLNALDEVPDVQTEAARREQERAERERQKADEKRNREYLAAYEKRRAAEDRAREAEAAAQAEREALSD